MPTYDYVCSACGSKLELYQPISEAPKRKCPKCKKQKLVRQIGAGAGILFRGSGFYQTDYRSDSYKESAKADKPSDAKPAADAAGKSDGAAKTDSSSADAKPAPKSDAKAEPKSEKSERASSSAAKPSAKSSSKKKK